MATGYVAHLQDPISGHQVRITQARLPQTCLTCDNKIHAADWIVSAGDANNWVHLGHLEVVMQTLGMAP